MDRPSPLKDEQRASELFQFRKGDSSAESHNIATGCHSRIATIQRNQSGEAKGVAIWINDSELKMIGIDPTNTTAIEIQVTEEGVNLTAASKHD